MIDLRQDGLNRGSPDERLGLGVMSCNEVVDSFDEFRDATKSAASKPFASQLGKPALDQVKPGAGCGREVEVKARMGREPLLDPWVAVSAVVVQDKMEVNRLGELPIQPSQEGKELLMTVARCAGAEHGPLSDVEGGEQAGGAVSLVVVSHRLAASAHHRKCWLSAVQCLNLGLLVHAEDNGLVGRVEVESNYVSELLQELLVGREFVRPDAMRLKIVSVPDSVYGLMAYAHQLGHAAGTPVCLALRRGPKGGIHHSCHIVGRNRALASSPGRDLGEGVGASSGKPLTPKQYGRAGCPKIGGNTMVGMPVRGGQDDLRTKHKALRRVVGSNPGHEGRAVGIGEINRRSFGPHTGAYK